MTDAVTTIRTIETDFIYKATHEVYSDGSVKSTIENNDHVLTRHNGIVTYDGYILESDRIIVAHARLGITYESLGEDIKILTCVERGFTHKVNRNGIEVYANGENTITVEPAKRTVTLHIPTDTTKDKVVRIEKGVDIILLEMLNVLTEQSKL